MTTPTVFETISDQPEATDVSDLFIAAESQNPSKPTNKVSLSHLLNKSSEVFNHDGLIYRGAGNISDFAGQQLQEADKTNAYQYPDNSRQFYVTDKSQAFPVTIPSDPSNDNEWSLVNAATEDWVAKNAGIAYKSIDDMLAGSPLAIAVGDYCSTGGTTWLKESGSNPVSEDNFVALNFANIKDFGAKGDGVSDDYLAIQRAFDYQYKTGVNIFFPAGTYNISQSVVVWTGSTKEEGKRPLIYGAGRDLTKIVKTTNNKSTVANHTSIDAIIIIANTYSKDGNIIDAPSSNQTACYNGEISDISFNQSAPSALAYTIYSYGIFYWDFSRLELARTTYGMAVEYWNVFCNYNKIEIDRCEVGFEFSRTNFGSNTTMNFTDCHCNGVDIACYRIIGTAVMTNCSIDGGGGDHIVCIGKDRGAAGFLSGNVTMYNCHHESPAMFSGKRMFTATFGSKITMYRCGGEIPYVNSLPGDLMCFISNYSRISFNDSSFVLRDGVLATNLKFSNIDDTSRLIFKETDFNTESFNSPQELIRDPNEKLVLVNRFRHDESQWSKYSTSPSAPVITATYSDPRVQVNCIRTTTSPELNGVMLPTAFDLTHYTKLYIQGDVEFVEGNATPDANYEAHFQKSLIPDGSTSIVIDDKRFPSSKLLSNYSQNNFEKYIDITDLKGLWYVGIGLYGVNINSNIQEMSLIR